MSGHLETVSEKVVLSVLEEFIQRVNKPRKSWRGNTPHMEPEEASEHR